MLKEILGGEELADFRQTTLVQGLAALRRRRQRRHVLTVCALASLPALLVLGVLLRGALGPSQAHKTVADSALSDVSAPNHRNPDVQFISDEQLFALFPGRPMALIGKPGHQELVFLDRSGK
jgi:hypothetical protein